MIHNLVDVFNRVCELIDTLWNVNKNTMELKEIESMN